MNGQVDVEVDYKRKYKNLKRKLKFLVYVSTIIVSVTVQSCVVILQVHARLLLCTDFMCGFLFPGTRMFSGGAEESTEKTSQSFQGQKVRLHYVTWKCVVVIQYYMWAIHVNVLHLFCSFLLDRLLQYERVDEDSSGSYYTSSQRLLSRMTCLLGVHLFLSWDCRIRFASGFLVFSSRFRCNSFFRK